VKKLFFATLVGIAFCSVYSLKAYIYEIKVLRKWDDAAHRYQFVIGCSDFHDKTHSANGQQRSYLTHLLAKQNKSMKVILEDLSSPNNIGSYGHKQFWLNSNRGILASLTKECKTLGLDAENIEYRYCRVISLGGLLRQLDRSPYESQPACAIRVSSLVDEVRGAMKQVLNYNDGTSLNRWYKESCAQVKKSMQALGLDEHAPLSSAAYFEKISAGSNKLLILKRLLTFDSGLLDCALTHSIINTADKAIVVALAGGTHIDRAFEQLKARGYTQIYTTPVSFRHDYDVANALGSPIMPGGYCVKPEPIELSLLEEYL